MVWWRRLRITLCLEPDELRLLVVRGQQVESWGRAPLPRGTLRGDVIHNPQAIARALQTLWEVHRVPSSRALVSMPGLQTSVRLVTLPPHESADNHTALEIAARFWPTEVSSVAWQVMEHADRRTLLLLRVPQAVVDRVYTTLGQAGVRVQALEPKPLALLRAVGHAHCVILDGEPSLATVVIADEAIPLLVSSHPLDVPLLSTVHDKAIRLAEFLEAAVQEYNGRGRGRPVDASTPVFCTGALGASPFLRRLVQEALGYRVADWTPSFPLPPELPQSRYAANVGLALKHHR
ncbi:MAG: hypothetical protein Q9O62_02135 [Ardenticatenia bacterium]|nr:hypothetical protein [Ardenticatenia bacterium]